MTVRRWRAWYTEGRTFDGETFEDWRALPDDGALEFVVCFEDGTSRMASGNDRYWSVPGGVFLAHSNDPADEITERYPGASIKRGMWTTETDMARVHDEAVAYALAWTESKRAE